MAEQKYYTILTEVGKAKIANATAMGEKVKFTKMQLGDGGGNQYDPQEKQTELKNKVWEGNISNIKLDENNSNWIVVETAIPGSAGGFTVREVGIFDDEGELLAIGKYPETYKPLVDDGCVKDLFVRVILMVVNTSTITLKIDPTVILSSMKNLEDLRKELNTKIDTTKTDLEKKIDKVVKDLGNIELTGNKVTIEDTDNNFVSGAVEGALKELATKDKDLDKRIDDNKTEIDKELEKIKQSGSDFKDSVASAITAKGVSTSGTDDKQTFVNNIDSIKTKLPINEGDVGVTEDSEGNVYGVKQIEERELYEDEVNKVSYVSSAQIAIDTNKNSLYWGNDGYLYATFSKKVLKINPNNLEIVWEVYPSSTELFLEFDDNFIYAYASAINYNFPAFKLSYDGSTVYTYASTTSITTYKGYIYTLSEGKITKLSQENEIIWEYSKDQFLEMQFTENGYIYYIARPAGSGASTRNRIIGKLTTDGEFIGQVSVYDTYLFYVDAYNDNVYLKYYANGYIFTKYSSDLKTQLWKLNTTIESVHAVGKYLIVSAGDMNSNTYYVQKINLNGELIWNYPASIGTIVLDYRGNIYSSSSKLSSNGSICYGNIPDATGVGIPIAVDDEGYIFIYGKYADKLGILKYKDNYTLEKIAVLNEREVK